MSGPIIHCITNTVTATRVADALAAMGAEPILASAPEEVGEVAARADALVLNCGTPSRERFAALRAAAIAAREATRPIVLDPVGCGASAWRTRNIRELAREAGPTIVRGNVAEVAALAGLAGGPALRGIRADAAGPADLARIATAASVSLQAVVLATDRGTDVAADGGATEPLTVDVPVLGLVVGAGDVLSAMVGAFLARGGTPLAAALAAHAAFAAAVRDAGSAGPGGFWAAFVDALAAHG